jgi:hypothetical protein
MDNTDIERIAAPDLGADALALLVAHQNNDDVVFFLARFAWQGELQDCVPILLAIACDAARGRYTRIASARAVMAMGSAQDIKALWNAIASESPLDRRILAELVEDADPDEQTLVSLGESIAHLEPFERFSITGLEQALHHLVDRLPIVRDGAGLQLLFRLVEILSPFLNQEPHVERGECHVSEANAWLMPIALHAVDRLVATRSAMALAPQALAIMRNMPALRFWRQGELNEYREQLRANVPRWTELNDTLYWTSIAERRAFIEKKDGKRLTDDWHIAFMQPFWGFDIAGFDRCVDWIATRPLQDDRMVALSRAFTLYREYDRPDEWLSKLRVACGNHAELAAQLEDLLDPLPSPQVQKMEEEHLEYERKREEEEVEQARIRAEWIETLRANPERVINPEGLAAGEFSNDQYHLMMSARDRNSAFDRGYTADWRSLEKEFGKAVALAYRTAAINHWRHYKPALLSEGAEGGGTPYSLVFGMAGLAIEAEEDESFPRGLSSTEVERALRYVTWELNGFPDWFETLFNTFPETGLEAIRKEALWELERRLQGHEAHHILHDLVYHSPWLHEDVAPILYDWFTDHSLPDADGLRYAIAIMKSGSLPPDKLAELARRKVENVYEEDQHACWFALWVDADAAPAITALEKKLIGLTPEKASLFAQCFIADLVGGRHGTGPRLDAFRTAAHLKALYVLMHRYIVAEDDIERAGKGAYSPTLRDNAQEARNQLFALLSEIPGQETYEAISALAEEHPSPAHRSWMRVRARERAIADADEPAWRDCDVWSRSQQISDGDAAGIKDEI